MATVTNAAKTSATKAIREQLENTVYNTDPTEVPLFSLTASNKRSVQAVTYDYLTEHLPDRAAKAPQPEGYVNANTAPTMPERKYGTTMLLKRDATVTGDFQASNHAGIPNPIGRAIANAGLALKIDFDEYFSRGQARQDDNGTVGSITEGLAHAIKTNVSRGAGGAAGADAYTASTAGTARPLTEDIFDDTLQLAWTNGSKADWALVGGHQKRVISKFTGRANGRYELPQGKLAIGGVNLLMSDFGDIKISMSRNVDQSTVLIINPDYLKQVVFRGFDSYETAKVGDATTRVLQARLGLQVSNELAHAAIFDLTTAP